MIIFAALAAFAAGALAVLGFLGWRYRPAPPLQLKLTTPDGTALDLDTVQLYGIWSTGHRTNDGYVDMLELSARGRPAGWRLWVRPVGWTEPDRTAALDGTAALPERYQR